MKNYYLFFLLLFLNIGRSQINTNVSDYVWCAYNGQSVYNLYSKEDEILGNLNASDYSFAYFTSEADAQANINALSQTAASFYENTTSPETIYVRVKHLQNNTVEFTHFNLVTNEIPVAQTAVITFCNPNAEPSFDLAVAVPQVIGNQSNMEVIFYRSMDSFDNMYAGVSYTFSSLPQTVGASIRNTVTGCISERVPVTLNTCANPCPSPTNLIANLQVDNETVIIGWIGNIDFSAYQVFFLPAGSPIPTAATAPTGTTVHTSYDITGLTPLTCYDIYVRSVCSENSFSQIAGPLQVCTNPCLAPSGITIPLATITAQTAMVNWVSGAQIISHDVYYTPAGGPNPNEDTAGGIFVPLSGPSNSYIITNLVPGVCYDVYVRATCNSEMDSAWTGPQSFCTTNCLNAGNCPDNITLVAFLDENNNGTREFGEPTFTKGSFTYVSNDSGILQYGSSSNGVFIFSDNNPLNLYDLGYTVEAEFAPYYSTITTYSDINVPIGGGSNTYFFPIRLIQNYSNLEIYLIPWQNPRPGFNYVNWIKYKNTGTNAVASGNIAFIKDSLVSISNISENGTTPTSDGFSFDFDNLVPGEERTLEVSMQVPTIPTVHLGQVLTNSVAITPILDDAVVENNSATMSQVIVGSYDPNDKTEAHGGKVAMNTFTTEDYLTYTIQFENTGTASAEFIRVEDLLHAGLNPDTVEMLSASHPYNMRRINNKLVWNFYNINLPPTASNPTQSHGYIQFRVKPTEGYTVGTMIPNAADIYFDYNPAIVTDTFETHFVETLSNDVFSDSNFYMVPNPANNLVRLGWNDAAQSIENIEITDILGQSVYRTMANSSETIIDVSPFSKGIYFVELTTKSHLKTVKKLIID